MTKINPKKVYMSNESTVFNYETELKHVCKERFDIPKILELNAEHGVVEDIHLICDDSEKDEFEEKFVAGIRELGMHLTDEKQRIHSSRYAIDESGTRIFFKRNEGSTEQELFIEGIQLKPQPSQFGGGAFNLARTFDSLIGVVNGLKERFPDLENYLPDLPTVRMSAILNLKQAEELPIQHLKINPISGDCRTSLIFHLKKQRFYFTKKKATTHGESNYTPILNERQSLVLQQIADYNVLHDFCYKQYEAKDHLFWLLPKDIIDKGFNEESIWDTLKHTRIVSFNLYEAARFINQVPIEKNTHIAERMRAAKIAAQTLHRIGLEVLVITDEDKGAYVSIKNKIGYMWKHFPISPGIQQWINEEYLQSDFSGKEFIFKDKMDFVGCGDSFGATVAFCSQYLGIKEWNFIFTFAHMIAGMVSRCSKANIGDLDLKAIAEIFLKALKERNQEGWIYVPENQDLSNPFYMYEKRHALHNMQYNLHHEIIILVGIPGAGKKATIGELKDNINSPEHNYVKEIARKWNVLLNTVSPVNKEFYSKDFVSLLENIGHFIGGRVDKDEEDIYLTDKFLFKVRDKNTVDIVWAHDIRQAINLWFDLMEIKQVTFVQIVNLDATRVTLRRRLENRGHSSEVIDELMKHAKAQSYRAQIADYSGGFTLDTNRQDKEVVTELLERVLGSLEHHYH